MSRTDPAVRVDQRLAGPDTRRTDRPRPACRARLGSAKPDTVAASAQMHNASARLAARSRAWFGRPTAAHAWSAAPRRERRRRARADPLPADASVSSTPVVCVAPFTHSRRAARAVPTRHRPPADRPPLAPHRASQSTRACGAAAHPVRGRSRRPPWPARGMAATGVPARPSSARQHSPDAPPRPGTRLET
jgi:hypothetical protein